MRHLCTLCHTILRDLLNAFASTAGLILNCSAPSLEFAMRRWARQSASVVREIDAAGDARVEALARMLRRYGYDPLAANVRGRTIYLTQIGYISMKAQEPPESASPPISKSSPASRLIPGNCNASMPAMVIILQPTLTNPPQA